jgi:hypothetical protein
MLDTLSPVPPHQSITPQRTSPVSSQNQDIIESRNPIKILFPESGLVWDSKLLESHFGIVPGVLIAEWMMQHRGGLPIHTFTRRFHHPIAPWMYVQKWIDNWVVKIVWDGKIIADMNYRTNETIFEDFRLPDDFSSIVDGWQWVDWIPHGEDFRFCDKIGYQGDILYGEWGVTNQYIWENDKIPFWQIEEACAQMMLWAYRKKSWEESGYGTYAEANTKWSKEFDILMKWLKKWDKIHCSGRAEEIKDERQKVKQLRFIYSCYIWEKLLFQWNIIWNCIPKKVWERQFQSKK